MRTGKGAGRRLWSGTEGGLVFPGSQGGDSWLETGTLRRLVDRRPILEVWDRRLADLPGQEQTGSEPDRQAATKCRSVKRATESELARSERGADWQVWSE